MRYCHQYAPGYIKWGCDATVYDGFPDFIFANNTDYPIKIVTYWNNNNVTVEILGTKVDDSYVEMVSETVDVIPWETVYEETDELAPGEKQEIQTPIPAMWCRRGAMSMPGTGASSPAPSRPPATTRAGIRSSASARQSPESHTYCLKSSKRAAPTGAALFLWKA